MEVFQLLLHHPLLYGAPQIDWKGVFMEALQYLDWPSAGGRLGALIRSHDWSATSLGPISTWPQSLKSTIDILLRFPAPVVMLWGADGVVVYNDAYYAFSGKSNHNLFGCDFFKNKPANAGEWLNVDLLKRGLKGDSIVYGDQEFTLCRDGHAEQVWLDLDYIPIFDENGEPAGIFLVINDMTEKVRAEQQLRRNERQLRFALDAAHMGTWSWDAVHDISSADEIYRNILGEGPDADLSFASCLEHRVHLDDREWCTKVLQKSLDPNGDGRLAAEFRLIRPDGQEVWLKKIGQTHFEGEDSERHAVRITGILQDVTAEHHAADRLRKSEERLSAIFAKAGVGLSEISLEGRFLTVNDELCRMLGRSREQLLEASIRDVTHPDDFPRSLLLLQRLIETGNPASVDKRCMRPDGTVVWVSSGLTRLDDERGKPRTVLAVIFDLTKRKQAEEKLRESEQRFRALAESSPVLIWQLDPEGNSVYMNPRYTQLVAVDPAEQSTFAWRSVIHPEDAPSYIEAVAHAQQARVTLKKRVRIKSKDGQWRWLESYGAPWFTADGRYAGHVGISIDITDAVNAQEELIVSNERLDLALEGSGDGVWDWNPQSNELICSRRLKEILGYSEDDFFDYSENWEQRIHPEDLPAMLSALNACLNGAASFYRSEYRVQCKEGKWKWVLARAIVVARDADKKPLRMTGTVSDISEKRRAEEVIWQQANFDPLTGLPNRRLFRDRLDQEVKKSHRTGFPVALLFIDLDHFKEANDVLGHDMGDLLLIEAANRISSCVRESDTVARLGGDEFTAILPQHDDVAHVKSIAQKMVDALAQPFHLGNEVVYLSGSIGITFYPTDASDSEELIRNADQAMYAAKSGGRNQFRYFTRLMQQQAHDRLRLIGDLRNALREDQFEVYYQPIVDLATEHITKAEALLRWHHPKLGLIEPLSFISFAEETGLINEIGDWVFKQAAACAKSCSARLGIPFQISVNKSPIQFLSHYESVNWPNHLRNSGMPGSSISVEITEGILLNASAIVVNKLLQYRDAGIQVAIDDFGTGYSSMAYLRKFDVDYLKVDQSFIRDMVYDVGNRAIVKSIVVMAHELGLQVIAEGIETAEQRQLVIDSGCDFGQGFLFSKAIPHNEFERLLAHSYEMSLNTGEAKISSAISAIAPLPVPKD